MGPSIEFPEGFVWGAATAGHQIEGNNVNASMWPQEWADDSFFEEPSGDACDSYHRYGEDLDLLADAGLGAYRFSVEWSRVEPEPGYFSVAALDHYRRVCEACLGRGVRPFVTLNHFTVPPLVRRPRRLRPAGLRRVLSCLHRRRRRPPR